MKKALLCMITATITFFIGFYAAAYCVWYNTPYYEVKEQKFEIPESESAKRSKLFYDKLPDKKQDRLHGAVKNVCLVKAEFIEKDGAYTRVKTSPTSIGTNRRGPDCGYRSPDEFFIKATYDDSGSLLEELHCKGSEIFIKIIHRYDSEGRVIESCNYSNEGSLVTKTIYQYRFDSYGNWIEQIPLVIDDEFGKNDIIQGYYRRILYYKK